MLTGWLSDLRYRLRALFRRDAMERELDAELRFHLEREAEKYVGAGMSPGEAARRARLEFGGVDRFKEESREARGLTLVDWVAQDLRYASRGLKSSPGFAAGVIVTLALGIGVNAAMFGVIDRLLFRPPPFLRDPARVHRVYLSRTEEGKRVTDDFFQFTRYRDLTRWSTSFSATAGFADRTFAVGVGDDTREMTAAVVSSSFFDFFAARAAIGRFFTAAEDTVPMGAAVVVLSHPLWETRFGRRADVIGQTLLVGTLLCTVIGVAPRGFVGVEGSNPPALFLPITTYAGSLQPSSLSSQYYTTYSWGWMSMLVRLRPEVSVAAASEDLTTAYRRSYAAERELTPSIAAVDSAQPRAMAGPIQIDRGPTAGGAARVVAWIGGSRSSSS